MPSPARSRIPPIREIALDRARFGAPISPHATERQSAPTELTVAGGPRVRILLAPAVSQTNSKAGQKISPALSRNHAGRSGRGVYDFDLAEVRRETRSLLVLDADGTDDRDPQPDLPVDIGRWVDAPRRMDLAPDRELNDGGSWRRRPCPCCLPARRSRRMARSHRSTPAT